MFCRNKTHSDVLTNNVYYCYCRTHTNICINPKQSAIIRNNNNNVQLRQCIIVSSSHHLTHSLSLSLSSYYFALLLNHRRNREPLVDMVCNVYI